LENSSMSSRPQLYDFHGVAMTHCVTDNREKVKNFQARPDDILIATYPKAGQSNNMYKQVLQFLSPERQSFIPIFERVPFLEIAISTVVPADIDGFLTKISCLTLKSHFTLKIMVYVARNAKDNMVSFYHFDHMNMVQPEPGEWSSYFQRFLDGQMLYGSWYDHVGNWWNKTKTYPKLHYMFYEDIAEDTEREIDKLCSFLRLSPSAEDKKTIVELVHFDNMKNDDMANCSKLNFLDFKISPFLRKGKVGDWKNHFTVAQNEVFNEDYKSKMKDPTLRFRTEI
uniref:Sulfotransferase n=1 Tax=Poecilia reticulata TaxID=8081 RepID=A0A3P9N0B2_POERE